LRDLLCFYVVDVARLPGYEGGIKGILANPTTKVLHGVADWGFLRMRLWLTGALRSQPEQLTTTQTILSQIAKSVGYAG